MKKIQAILAHFLKPFSYLAFMLLIIFASCKKDDDDVPALLPPKITPVHDTTTVYKRGETATISFKVSAPGGIQSILISTDSVDVKDIVGDTSAFVTGQYVVPHNASGIFGVGIRVIDGQKIARASQAVALIKVEEVPCADHLTGCSSAGKTWVLKQEAGALLALSSDGSEVFKSDNSTAAVRSCLFNDEYTFKPGGALLRNTKDDIWGDEENGNVWPADFQTAGCHNLSALPEKYATWGTKELTYTATPGSIKIDGEGAYMGLYKAGNAAITDQPESSNTYQIVSLTESELIIKKTYDWGSWTFAFESK